MLYYIYIGNNRTIIDHLSKVTGGMFMAVSSCNKAVKIIDGIRERYNTSILYEQTDDVEKDCKNIDFLHKRFPRVYMILVTESLQSQHRKSYLQAGINNTLPPKADEGAIRQMDRFLNVRKTSKLEEFTILTARCSTPFTCPYGSALSMSFSPPHHSLYCHRCLLPPQ